MSPAGFGTRALTRATLLGVAGLVVLAVAVWAPDDRSSAPAMAPSPTGGAVAAPTESDPAGGGTASGGTASSETSGGTRAADGDGARPGLVGSEVFGVVGCGACHRASGFEPAMQVGPSLAGAASWAAQRRPGLTAQEYIRESVRAPGAFVSPAWNGGVGPTAMPQLDLTDDELDAIVSFLLGE